MSRLLRSRPFLRALAVVDLFLAAGALAVGAVSLTRPLPAGVWIGFAVGLSIAGVLTGAAFLVATSERDTS